MRNINYNDEYIEKMLKQKEIAYKKDMKKRRENKKIRQYKREAQIAKQKETFFGFLLILIAIIFMTFLFIKSNKYTAKAVESYEINLMRGAYDNYLEKHGINAKQLKENVKNNRIRTKKEARQKLAENTNENASKDSIK